MKAKLGNLTFGPKTRWKTAGLLGAQALLIGLMVLAKHYGQAPSTSLFIVINIIIIPALARQLFKGTGNDIENTNQ
ncbi:hypothetical protein [Spirosoma fluviale]|nr:hypothetical protein [Spirosoma fluviale]